MNPFEVFRVTTLFDIVELGGIKLLKLDITISSFHEAFMGSFLSIFDNLPWRRHICEHNFTFDDQVLKLIKFATVWRGHLR